MLQASGCVEVEEADKHLAMHRSAPQQRIIQPQKSTVQNGYLPNRTSNAPKCMKHRVSQANQVSEAERGCHPQSDPAPVGVPERPDEM